MTVKRAGWIGITGVSQRQSWPSILKFVVTCGPACAQGSERQSSSRREHITKSAHVAKNITSATALTIWNQRLTYKASLNHLAGRVAETQIALPAKSEKANHSVQNRNFNATCTCRGGAAFTTYPKLGSVKSPCTAAGPKN